ncbi:hypothetical protein TrCOL_g3347 [Triparma columacea]|uniref:H/ACA ribonucleoprotein complex subunit 2 n=1 Tax=Triparma columacea TaxID=722753 RepID=A0A9W7LBM1_9STRA|nr:hypothetical protein TrCOL_g3347 [Triparma columacea]
MSSYDFSPLCTPLASNSVLTTVILDLVENAKKSNQLKLGVNEAAKCLNRSIAEIIILAADAQPVELLGHIPLLCEDKNVPYVFVVSKNALGKAAGRKETVHADGTIVMKPVICATITTNDTSSLKSDIQSVKIKIESLLM